MTLKVLVLNHAAHLGGGERVLLDLLGHMDRQAFDPLVVLPQAGPMKAELEKLNIPVRILALPADVLAVKRTGSLLMPVLRGGVNLLSMARKLARLVKEERIDVIYTNSLKADLYGSLVSRLTGIPVVWRLHDFVGTNMSWVQRKALVWAAGYQASEVLTVSKAVEKAFVTSGAPADKVRTVYNGMKVSGQKLIPEALAKLRLDLGLQPGDSVVGIFSWLIPWKGHETFLRAAKQVASERPNTRFLVVGDALPGSSYRQELESLVTELGLIQQVVFAGYRSDVKELMQCVDVCVHASVEPDPLPTVVLEGMVSGTPTIATNVGGVPEMVIDGETGLLVPPGDSAAMARAVARVLDSSMEERRDMADQAQQRIQALFPMGGAVQAIQSSLAMAVTRGNRPNV